MEKYLGKISTVRFGLGGYQGVCIGLHLSFEFDGSGGISTSISAWDPEEISCDEHTKWTEEDRDKQLSNIMRRISKLLSKAKVDEVYRLKGVPVEITIEGMALKDWRILTEVL